MKRVSVSLDPVRDQNEAREFLGGDVTMSGGWSGVPVSETSLEGPRLDVHSSDRVVAVTSEVAVGDLISTRLSLIPLKIRQPVVVPAKDPMMLSRLPLVIACEWTPEPPSEYLNR